MFSNPNLWVMICGILMGLTLIVSSVVFVNRLFVNSTKDVLVRFVIMVFTALVSLFIVDIISYTNLMLI